MGGVKFPRDVAAELLHNMATTGTWRSISEQERTDPSNAATNRALSKLVRPLPTGEQIEMVLDAVYVASLLEEEGRRVEFTLAYLSDEGARRQQHRTFPFKKPVPLVPSRLAKHALAAAPLTTSLGVWPGADGQLEVWGLTHHGNHTFDVDLTYLPAHLSVRVLRIGTFTLHFDSRLLLLFSRDHFHLFDPNLANRIDLVDILRDRVGLEVPVAVALRRVCLRMVALGHGGTILLTEKGVRPNALKMHDTLTMRDGAFTLLKDVVEEDRKRGTGEGVPREGAREGTAVHQQYAQDEKHREALDYVAQLTAVDGAVVLDDELNVLGFGVTIATAGTVPSVTAEDPRALGKTLPLDLERRGNRHRSAVHFCAQQMGLALAFVASQDGDFSLVMRKADGGVHVLGPYELGVGL
jgi:hypothetical protein